MCIRDRSESRSRPSAACSTRSSVYRPISTMNRGISGIVSTRISAETQSCARIHTPKASGTTAAVVSAGRYWVNQSSMPSSPVLASTGLDGMDDWFTQYLPALTTAAVVPLALGVWILAHDWVSALILVLTIPLIPLFMVLIGRYTEDRVEQAADGLDRLSDLSLIHI